jgi:hypothetical protein
MNNTTNVATAALQPIPARQACWLRLLVVAGRGLVVPVGREHWVYPQLLQLLSSTRSTVGSAVHAGSERRELQCP